MKLIILGSGSPEAYVRRASSGYLIEVGNDRILFDCGGGVFDNLIRSGLMPSDITHIFFSHLHSDHMMDYARLVHAAWDESGKTIRVFGPPPIKAITEGLFGSEGVLAHDLRARTELPQSQEVWVARGGTLPRNWPNPIVHEVIPGKAVEENGWRIESANAPHAQPFLESIAYSLVHENKKFVYTGDAGLCTDVENLASNADLLLHWCYRLDGEHATPSMSLTTPTPSEIGKMAKRTGASALILTHFRKHMDKQEYYDQAIRNATEAFGQIVVIAEDLMQIEI